MEEAIMWLATKGLDQYLWAVMAKNASTIVVGSGAIAGILKLVSRHTKNTVDDEAAKVAGKVADFLKRRVK